MRGRLPCGAAWLAVTVEEGLISLRICIFAHHYHPQLSGIANYVDALSHALIARGNEVLIVAPDTQGVGCGFTREDGVEVLRLPCLSPMDGRLPIPLKNRLYHRLFGELSARQWDGVFVNTRLFSHSLEGLKLAKNQDHKAIVLDHGSAYLSFGIKGLDWFVRRYEDAITRKVKAYKPDFYGVSAKSSEWLAHFGIASKGVLSNSIDAAAYRAKSSGRDFRSELGIAPEQPLVAFVGRLIPEKGISSLVEASCSEALRERGVVFVLAGEGPLASEVEEASNDELRWIGRIDAPDVAALFLQADIHCLPSRSEGFSTVLLEASACGTPSVVTDVGGARELLPDDSCGLIIPSMTTPDVVKAIVRLCDEPGLLARESYNCRKLVEQHYSWDTTAEALEAAIRLAV